MEGLCRSSPCACYLISNDPLSCTRHPNGVVQPASQVRICIAGWGSHHVRAGQSMLIILRCNRSFRFSNQFSTLKTQIYNTVIMSSHLEASSRRADEAYNEARQQQAPLSILQHCSRDQATHALMTTR
jgi:hypothetical protein